MTRSKAPVDPRLLRLVAVAIAGSAIGLLADHAFAQNETAPAAAAAQHCLRPASWMLLDGESPRVVTIGAVMTAMAAKDVVLLGEQHDSEDDHRWQLQVLAALHAQRPDMVIGFEMFPRRVQPVLDDWVAGKLTVKQLLEQSQWDLVWRMPAELYLPLLQFARSNRIPMVALNVEQKLIRAVAEKGWAAVPQADREGVGQAAPVSPAYVDVLFDVYAEHPPSHTKDGAKAQRGDSAFGRFVESQTAWDRAMAEALAQRLPRAPGAPKPLVVGIMGSGHIRYGQGVAHQLRDLGVTSIGALLPVAFDFDCKELRSSLADVVFALPEAVKMPEPLRLGVRLDETAGIVRISDVTAGGLAERSGLKTGDQIVEVAGQAVNRTARVTAAIRAQPAGTWLPFRVKRGDESLELIVKVPPAQ